VNQVARNEARNLLVAAFADRPAPAIDAATREARRRRAFGGIQQILSRARPPLHARVQPIRWGETAAVVALAAGLALAAGRILPDATRTSAVTAFHAIDAKGQILCDRNDGKNWTTCDPTQVAGVVGFRTLERAGVSVETSAGVRLDLEASSTLLMPQSNASALASQVTLTDGLVDVKVPKLGTNRLFSVLTPNVTIIVHGTAFSVEVKQSSNQTMHTCVRLREGTISVQGDGQQYELIGPATWGCDTFANLKSAPSEPSAESPKRGPEGEAAQASRDGERRPIATNIDRSTLPAETKLLQRAIAAERRNAFPAAEKSLRQLLTLYPNSVVAPEARAALERISAKTNARRQ
jgi:hypothetical protein